jgi:hypothetical protein
MVAHNKLTEYLRLRLDRLIECNATMENKLRWDMQNVIDSKEVSREEINKALFHLQFGIANSFRYMLLIGMCAYLEESIVAIGRILIPDYDLKFKKLKIKNTSWLHRSLRLLENEASFDSKQIAKKEALFDDMVTLRNCIAHHWGKIDESRYPTEVEAAVDRLIKSGKRGNYDLVTISKDRVLALGDNMVTNASFNAEGILDTILNKTLRVSIT